MGIQSMPARVAAASSFRIPSAAAPPSDAGNLRRCLELSTKLGSHSRAVHFPLALCAGPDIWPRRKDSDAPVVTAGSVREELFRDVFAFAVAGMVRYAW